MEISPPDLNSLAGSVMECSRMISIAGLDSSFKFLHLLAVCKQAFTRQAVARLFTVVH